jgi:hypothetical protein
VTGSQAILQRSHTRFDSWRRHLQVLSTSRECVGRTAVFEAARPGSIPGREIWLGQVLGVCRIRIRPCEGRGPGSIPGEDIPFLTLEPDGQATGCNPVKVGSTPTGVFAFSSRSMRLSRAGMGAELFLKVRRIRAAIVDQAIHGPDLPKNSPADISSPIEAVREALEYVARNWAHRARARPRGGAALR